MTTPSEKIIRTKASSENIISWKSNDTLDEETNLFASSTIFAMIRTQIMTSKRKQSHRELNRSHELKLSSTRDCELDKFPTSWPEYLDNKMLSLKKVFASYVLKVW